MSDSVSYREYRDADFPALRDLLISIWGDVAEVDLRECLSRSGFTRVAVLHGEPVGLILGQCDRGTGKPAADKGAGPGEAQPETAARRQAVALGE